VSQFVDGNTKAFICDEADNVNGSVLEGIRCKMDSDGKVTIAGVGDTDLGTNVEPVFKQGARITLHLNSKAGTQKAVAAAAITVGSKVYTAANGKVSSTAATGSFLRGIALQSASGDNSVLEILPLIGDTAN